MTLNLWFAGGQKRSADATSAQAAEGLNANKRTTRSASQLAARAATDDGDKCQGAKSAAPDPDEEVPEPRLFPMCPAEPLTQQATDVVAEHLDAQAHDQFMKALLADDDLANVASQRGLLVKFNVKGLSNGASPLELEAPEFATVQYLKRRVTKASLLRGKFIPPERFILKRRVGETREHLPELTSRGTPTLLFDLGFRGLNVYELSMMSAPNTTDKVQQENMLRGAASAPLGPALLQYNDPALQNYQDMLQNRTTPQNPRTTAVQGASDAVEVASTHGRGTAAAAPPPLPPPAAVTEPAGNTVGGNTNFNGIHTSPRLGKPGKWQVAEVEALVKGVSAYGTSWACILDAYGKGRPIHEKRSAVDLKDKWRNLVKALGKPGVVPRSDIPEELRIQIMRLAQPYQRNGTEENVTPSPAS